MKKIAPLLLVLVLIIGIWFYTQPASTKPNTTAGQQSASNTSPTTATKPAQPAGTAGSPGAEADSSEAGETIIEDVKPASQVYKSAEEALEALNKGAESYDDLVLEQFADLGPDCSWCPQLFDILKEKILSPDVSDDAKSYFAEVLATTGKVENVSSLVDAMHNAPNAELKDIYAEALEVAYGDDKLVKYLSEHLSQEDEATQESMIAAITNHGSELAIDTLYKMTVEKGDPDGMYSLGLGLGELVPHDDALPYLVEIAKKRDQYSHLAIKAMLNNGPEGLRQVMNILAESSDKAVNDKLLADGIDHVNIEPAQVPYVKEIAEKGPNESSREFAKQILEDYNVEKSEDEDEEE